MKTLHKANSEYLATSKELKPHLVKCPIQKKYFVSVFFTENHLKSRGFIIIKQYANNR